MTQVSYELVTRDIFLFVLKSSPFIYNRLSSLASTLLTCSPYSDFSLVPASIWHFLHLKYTFNTSIFHCKCISDKDTFKCKHKLLWSLSTLKARLSAEHKATLSRISEPHLVHMKLYCFKPQRVRTGNFPAKMQELTNISSYLCLPYLHFYWSWE